MKRICVCLATAAAAAFSFNLGAQPPDDRDSDRPRDERRDGDRDRGGDRDGDRRGPGGEGRGPGGEGRGPGGGFGGGFGGFRMPPNPVVAAIDADGNGELSEAEIGNAVKALKALDKNNDGKLSGDEIRPQFGGPGGEFRGGGSGFRFDPNQFATRTLTDNDKDKDGKLSKDEAPEWLSSRFDRLDNNKDGFADKAELEESARRMGEGGRGPGGPGGRGPGGDDRGGRERPPTRDRDGDRPATPDVSADDL